MTFRQGEGPWHPFRSAIAAPCSVPATAPGTRKAQDTESDNHRTQRSETAGASRPATSSSRTWGCESDPLRLQVVVLVVAVVMSGVIAVLVPALGATVIAVVVLILVVGRRWLAVVVLVVG